LQRLFMSLKTVEQMTWHHSYAMVHPFNYET
jgi:hypothetical protein